MAASLLITADRAYRAGLFPERADELFSDIFDAEVNGRAIEIEDKEGEGLFSSYLFGLMDLQGAKVPPFARILMILNALHKHGADPKLKGFDRYYAGKKFSTVSLTPMEIIEKHMGMLFLPYESKIKVWFEAVLAPRAAPFSSAAPAQRALAPHPYDDDEWLAFCP